MTGSPIDDRPDSTRRGYSYEWKQFAKRYLLKHPTCARCGQPARVVDHKAMTAAQMIDQFGHFILDEDLYQPLCVRCNTRKGANEDVVSDRNYFRAKEEFNAHLSTKEEDIGIV